MIVKHIGVRKGSKGLPGKHFAEVMGIPLIDWSMDQLIFNRRYGPIIVSTDDEEIYDRCVRKGAEDVGLRPKSLARADTPKWKVWQHSLKIAEGICETPIIAFLDLDASSPMRLPEDIDDAIDLFELERPDMVMSCCEARKNPYFNLVEPNEDGSLRLSKEPEKKVTSRQKAPLVYEHAASIYVISPDYLKRSKGLLDGRVIPFVMPRDRCVDVDTALDLKVADALMEERHTYDEGLYRA